MNRTNLTFRQLPRTYAGLIALHAPRPIHDSVGYENTSEIVDVLAVAGDKLNAAQADYLEVLTSLIEAYENENVPAPKKASAVATLRFLLDQSDMNGDALAHLLGVERSAAYKILKGSRMLTADHIRKLCARFHVSSDLFILL